MTVEIFHDQSPRKTWRKPKRKAPDNQTDNRGRLVAVAFPGYLDSLDTSFLHPLLKATLKVNDINGVTSEKPE